MIHYQISCSNPCSQFVEIELKLQFETPEPIILQLPAWRAGRYQLANFAQNIRKLTASQASGAPVSLKKTSKDRWELKAQSEVLVTYEYFAGKMDAGSAWVDEEQVYLNLVNCCFEISGQEKEEITVSLNLPDFPEQICTLYKVENSWRAANFQMLADSTILASKKLIHWEYFSVDTKFHIWIQGEVHFDQELFLQNFQKFTDKLIADFGKFPEEEYHFIFQLLLYPHYHGVEHRRGTVITFGPAEKLQDPEEMEELLGVSCHELYHAWNVCRIRPKELLPYDFSKETYTQSGLILEGVTTYMGDLYLLKSGVYSLETYLKHFEKIINREASSFGWRNNNILESSFDLWLDGYVPGIPDRKVNIYTRGALIMFCLDVMLLKNGSSLANVMTKMWEAFGKPQIGYELANFEKIVFEEVSETAEFQSFFKDFVYGYEDLFPRLQSHFSEIGISLEAQISEDWILHKIGVRVNSEGLILQIHPNSNAFQSLMKNDRILNWPIEKPGDTSILSLQVDRLSRQINLTLSLEQGEFYPEYRLSSLGDTAWSLKWKS